MWTTAALFLLIWVAFYAYWFISAWKTRSPVKRKLPQSSFFTYGIFWIALCIFLMNWLSPDLVMMQVITESIGTTVTGLLVTIAGLAFAIWARLHLGKNWSGMPTIRQDHTLTRTGPYRFVRHPIYSGILLGILGTAIGVGYFIIFCFTIIVFGLFVIKFRMEEKFLEEEFGEEYTRYKKEVKALIPYVI
jgi:protein-S-isoprenylcysteine O-methyltransferase Ste14